MQAAVVPEAGGEFELVERDLPVPTADEVRIAVEACGVCHSDAFVKEGGHPQLSYPRVPGHEVTGYVDAVGDDVSQWEEGAFAGAGWHGGHCFICKPVRRRAVLQHRNPDLTGLTCYRRYV